MKILISLSYYWPHISGLSVYAERLAENLHAAGNDVEIVCCKHVPNLPNEEVHHGVLIRRFQPTIRSGRVIFSPKLIFWVMKNIHDYDKLILNLPFPEAVLLATVAKLRRKSLLSVFHCDINIDATLIEKIQTLLARFANILTFMCSQAVVVNSVDYANSISYLRPFIGKVIEIPPLFPTGFQKKTKKNTVKKIVSVGFLGRVSKEKNLETLFEAVRRAKKDEFELVIAGPKSVLENDEYVNHLHTQMESLGNKIYKWGELDENRMKKFFEYIDLLALPSDDPTESFGMVQVEAMLSGVPVVATNRPGVRIPITKTGAGILVDHPYDANEWLNKLRSARQKMEILIKNTVKAKVAYDPRKVLRQWNALLSA